MARKYEVKKGKDGGKYTIITDDGKPNWINQTIVQIGKDMLKVKSTKGREYWVAKSDKVMTMRPRINDIAVVGTFESGWLVTDIIPYEKKTNKTKEELQKQMMEFESLYGGY